MFVKKKLMGIHFAFLKRKKKVEILPCTGQQDNCKTSSMSYPAMKLKPALVRDIPSLELLLSAPSSSPSPSFSKKKKLPQLKCGQDV